MQIFPLGLNGLCIKTHKEISPSSQHLKSLRWNTWAPLHQLLEVPSWKKGDGSGSVHTAWRFLPAPPHNSSSRFRPGQLTPARTSWCTRLLLQHPDRKTLVHEFLLIFLWEDEITGFHLRVEHMTNSQARHQDTFVARINLLCSREGGAPSHIHLGGKIPRPHSKLQSQSTAK